MDEREEDSATPAPVPAIAEPCAHGDAPLATLAETTHDLFLQCLTAGSLTSVVGSVPREAPSIVRFAISRVAPVSYCLCVSAFRRIDASETLPSFPFAAHGRCFCRRSRHPSFGRRRSFSPRWPAVASAAPRLRVQTLSDLASNHTESNAYRDRAHQAFVLPASIQLRCATEV